MMRRIGMGTRNLAEIEAEIGESQAANNEVIESSLVTY